MSVLVCSLFLGNLFKWLADIFTFSKDLPQNHRNEEEGKFIQSIFSVKSPFYEL